MERDVRRLHELLKQGTCCTVAMVQVVLELRKEKNPTLLHAMEGLCNGVHYELLCGALMGAACVVSVVAPHNASVMVAELSDWFVQTMEEEFGGSRCLDILDGSFRNRPLRCPAVIERTYVKAKEILERNGYVVDAFPH